MTTIVETDRVIVLSHASTEAVGKHVATVVREYLFRHGLNVESVPDEMLLFQIRNTYRDKRSALETGKISLAPTNQP